MKIRKIAGIASTTLSIVIALYFWLAIAIGMLYIASVEFEIDLFWGIVIGVIAVADFVLLFISQSNAAYVASLFTIIPLISFARAYGVTALAVLYVILLLTDRRNVVKIVGPSLCALFAVIIILLVMVGQGFAEGLPEWEDVSEARYASPDNSVEIVVYVSRCIEEGYNDYSNKYSVSAYPHDIKGIDLGPVVLKTPYTIDMMYEGKLEELPEPKVEWIDNDVVKIDGELYRVSDYIINKEVAD